MALIAFVISFITAAMIRDKGVGVYNQDPAYRIDNIYFKCIPALEKELKSSNLIEMQQLINDKYSFNQGYSFYIVDEMGNVKVQNSKGVQVIDKNELKDGKREYSNQNKYRKKFKISGCEYLKDGYFLYYVYLGYGEDDSMMMLWALIGFIIVFFILIWRRVSYISKIKSSVQIIAEGNLSYRVPIHYKNELRELAENINFMSAELEKEDRKRSEFLTNISHDLRTPLTTILGYIDIIKKDKLNSKEELNKYISIIERKGEYLRTMLEDFFEYSKLTSKDIVLNYENLELNELGRQIFEDEESEFDEKSLKLEVELSKEPVYIYGDPDLIGRAVNNIISNSLKYSKTNTVVKIKISKEILNNVSYGVFLVSNIPKDTVSEEEVNSFFERLYKKDQSRHEEGSGLGLSIVKDIVKLHGGSIRGIKEKEELIFKLFIKQSNI